jgi:transcriptional regulator with XRE-family HTH domain
MPTTSKSAVGSLLQYWRRTRQLSQLSLALEAGVSPRHVCFLETGRAHPSREMLLLLASALKIPLRERNALLLAAGFAPAYLEAKLEATELAPVRRAIDAILRQQEPYPAVVMNRQWNILLTNHAAARFFGFLLGDTHTETNVLRLMFHPEKLRPLVRDWEQTAEALIQRVHREAVGATKDPKTIEIVEEILAYPGVPTRWKTPNPGTPLTPVLPIVFQKGGLEFHFFSAVTTIGTPQDITLQELRIESFFPMNDATEQSIKALATFS